MLMSAVCTEMVMLYVISVGVYRDGDVVCHLLWRVQRW